MKTIANRFSLNVTRRTALPAALAILTTGAPLVAAPMATIVVTATAARADEGTVPIRVSGVAGITLPNGTEKVKDEMPGVPKLLEPLEGDAKDFGSGELGAREVIGWDFEKAGTPSRAAAKSQFIAALRGAGYTYDEVGTVQKNSAGPIQYFYTRNPKSGKRILGFYIDAKTALLVVWAQLAGGTAPQVAKAPSTLIGPTWRATSIGNTTFWSGSTYSGSGRQQAAMITFFADGTYKLQAYNQARSYDWNMEAYTWEEGKASFDGNLVVLRPTGGKHKGVDTKLAHKNFERPMTASEIRDNVRLYRWEMTSENGKPVMKMGNGLKNLTAFRPTTE